MVPEHRDGSVLHTHAVCCMICCCLDCLVALFRRHGEKGNRLPTGLAIQGAMTGYLRCLILFSSFSRRAAAQTGQNAGAIQYQSHTAVEIRW